MTLSIHKPVTCMFEVNHETSDGMYHQISWVLCLQEDETWMLLGSQSHQCISASMEALSVDGRRLSAYVLLQAYRLTHPT